MTVKLIEARKPGRRRPRRPATSIGQARKEGDSMHRLLWVTCLAVIICATPAVAEFYKYYDANGNVHFTDDYNKVPADQRPNVKGYVETEKSDGPDATAENPENKEPKAAASEGKDEAGGKSDYEARVKELDQRKETLKDERKTLMEENARLAELRKNIKTTEDTAQYNEKVRDLNQRFKAHDERFQQFTKDVEEYNRQVGEVNAAKKKTSK
jgi:hypothetical protein